MSLTLSPYFTSVPHTRITITKSFASPGSILHHLTAVKPLPKATRSATIGHTISLDWPLDQPPLATRSVSNDTLRSAPSGPMPSVTYGSASIGLEFTLRREHIHPCWWPRHAHSPQSLMSHPNQGSNNSGVKSIKNIRSPLLLVLLFVDVCC